MRAMVLAMLVLAVSMLGQARAADAPEAADRAAIRSLIEAQIAAFRRDDAGAAWAAASPEIQERFMTPEFFLEVVRSKYPAVYRPKLVQFRALRDVDGALRQDVYMVGPDGKGVVVTYSLQRQPDGTWRINGVQIHEAQEVGV
ncbi:DUF4864 domain-containing protein [Zavarzinia sp. CC-PAN008]|uniref:DUF4864 domain-containing protein n=1 Tax=Zavarzinia sp. CC-PAN008 TaxID=3243332 RepID=UPI003F743FE6